MSTKKVYIISAVFIFLTLSLACGISFSDSGESEPNLQMTRQVLQLTQSALDAGQNAPQPQQQQPDQQGDTSKDIAAEPEEEDDGIPCNDSHIISETIKDGTVFQPGEKFEKTWTLRNEGDCDWTTGYNFKFIEGNRLGGESSVKVPSVIEPNEDITFLVNLTAPNEAGDYTGVWQLFADDGEEMGRYWVKIAVEEPAPPPEPFAVTSVSTNLQKNYNGACPVVIDVEIYIKANGKGKVVYQPETSDLGKAPEDTINFGGVGTVTETYTWTIQNPGNFWLKVFIKEPNNQPFGPDEFTVNCQ